MSSHMSPEEFRRQGHAVVDWIADYYSRVERFPVLSRVKPGEIRAQLPKHPPQQGEPFERVFADVERIILPGITHWQSPNFFAYFPSGASGPACGSHWLDLVVSLMIWTFAGFRGDRRPLHVI